LRDGSIHEYNGTNSAEIRHGNRRCNVHATKGVICSLRIMLGFHIQQTVPTIQLEGGREIPVPGL
jgi:hypothetical protein